MLEWHVVVDVPGHHRRRALSKVHDTGFGRLLLDRRNGLLTGFLARQPQFILGALFAERDLYLWSKTIVLSPNLGDLTVQRLHLPQRRNSGGRRVLIKLSVCH